MAEITPATRASKVKTALDWLATCVIIVACSVLIYANWPRFFARRPPPAVPRTIIDIGSSGRLGNPHAALTIIEYFDYQCPFCTRFEQETVPALKREYIDTGKILLAYKHFPLIAIHPLAQAAAATAACAGLQGRFAEANAALFRGISGPTGPVLAERQVELGLKGPEFESCLKGAGADLVRADVESGTKADVRATPTLLIGTIDDMGRFKAALRADGFQSIDAIRKLVDPILAK